MILTRLGRSSFVLAILYLILFLFAWNKQRWLNKKSKRFNTMKFFVLCLMVTCGFRTIALVTIGTLDFTLPADSTIITDTSIFFRDDASGDELLFDKVMISLNVLPDFVVISTYVLLMLIWLENVYNARRHWFSAHTFRRNCLIAYLVFNILLYASQLIMYLALLTPVLKFSAEEVLHAIVYTELAGNVGLPAVMLLIWLGTSVKLAGFPLKNERAAERLACVNRNAVVWTVGRVLYGALLLAVVGRDWFSSSKVVTDPSPWVYDILYTCLYVFTEIVPFLRSLSDYKLYQLVMIVQAERDDKAAGLGRALPSGDRGEGGSAGLLEHRMHSIPPSGSSSSPSPENNDNNEAVARGGQPHEKLLRRATRDGGPDMQVPLLSTQ